MEVSILTRDTPRRRRLSLWAALYLTLIGTANDDDGESATEDSLDRR